MSTAIAILGFVIAIPGIATSIHLTILCLASMFYRSPDRSGTRQQRFLVLVPARNEALVIANTVASLQAATSEEDIVLVIADRCTDDTAAIARSAGVRVLERQDGATPGKAAAIRDGLAFASDLDWTATTTIDADSVVNEGFFDAVDAALTQENPLAQPRSEHIRSPGLLARASEAAFAMQGVALPRGRQVLGIGVRLRGTGMTMLRTVADSSDYSTDGASEDLFISLDLVLDGYTAEHVDEARLESLSAPTLKAGGQQRIRWEQGRLGAAKLYVPKLLKKGSKASIESAVLLATPPFAVAFFLIVVGALVMWLAGSGTGALIVLLFGALLGLDLAIALVETRAPLATWGSLLVAPFYVLWKVGLQIVAIARSRKSTEAWEPTSRD